MLRPWGRKFVEYRIDDLLMDAGITRDQFRLLLVVSNTDYSSNIPGLGIVTNLRIIKGLPGWNSHFMMACYHGHPEVRTALDAYRTQNQLPNSQIKQVDFAASARIYLDRTERLLYQDLQQKKQAVESRNMEAVLDLKRRIKTASAYRRSFNKQRRQQQQQQQQQQQHRT
ncbi:hypothetical protein DFQ27_001833, partial [Actinomortierella ambigua]